MAAIDFPASPTTGQLFVAGNGTSYQYNGTLWLASGQSVGGDFFATYTGTIPAAATVIVFPNVLAGNASGYYNVANGRFTPPAGTYRLQACLCGSPSAGAATNSISIRKNGVVIVQNNSTAAAANLWAQIFGEVEASANGTDYFDVSTGGGTLWDRAGATSWFSAFPISGIQGPPGTLGGAASTQAQMEAAVDLTTTVTPGRTQYHPGVAKAWGYVSSVGVLNAGYGCTTTRTGPGAYFASLSPGMSSSNYAVVTNVQGFNMIIATPAASNQVNFQIFNITTAALTDVPSSFAVFGDQ